MKQYLISYAVFTIAIAAAFGSSKAAAQVTWTEIHKPIGPYEEITWPIFPTADGLLMCLPSAGAAVFHSNDNGQDWTRLPLEGTSPYIWPTLCSPHQSSLPFLLAQWSGFFQVHPENLTVRRLEDFDSTVVTWAAASDNGHRIAVLANSERVAGLLFISEDGGRSWNRIHVQDGNFSPIGASAAFSGDTLLIASHPRILWKLPPGETTLHRASHSIPEGENPPWFLGDGLLLMQLDSSIVRSNDGGRTWRDTRTGLPFGPVGLIACARSQDGTVYALTNEGEQHHRLFRSADRGRTWNMLDRNGDPRITRFQLTPAGEVIWQLGTLPLFISSGLALTVPVEAPSAPEAAAGIYPHPLRIGSRGTLWLEGAAHAQWTMRIVDLRGSVRESRDLQADATGRIRIPFAPLLPSGAYVMELAGGMRRHLFHFRLLP